MADERRDDTIILQLVAGLSRVEATLVGQGEDIKEMKEDIKSLKRQNCRDCETAIALTLFKEDHKEEHRVKEEQQKEIKQKRFNWATVWIAGVFSMLSAGLAYVLVKIFG